MALIRNIHIDKAEQAIARSTLLTCRMLGALVVAEGIETAEERDYPAEAGVELMQGYLFCKPAFQALDTVARSAWPWDRG